MNNPTAFASEYSSGMTLLDYFAAAALIGIKSNPELLRICYDIEGKTQQQAIASMAYMDADAMLKEREKWA